MAEFIGIANSLENNTVMTTTPSLNDLLPDDMPPKQLNQPCSDEHLCEIALYITEWQSIAPFLGLSEINEEEIICEHPNKLKMQKIGMLRKWREKLGSRATYQRLAEAFWDRGKTPLVEKVYSLLESPKAKNTTPEDLSESSSTSRDIDATSPPSKRHRIVSSNISEIEPIPEQIKTLDELLQDSPKDDESNFLECSSSDMVKDPLLIRFSGPLATRKFQKINRAFSRAIHAGKTEDVEWATEKILSMNVSTDFKAITLLYRASCMALVRGQMDAALLDCDRAIERAKVLECQNGSLITGRALRQKTSILRTLGKCDKALECMKEAKENFFLAAPSSDTASLLYEEVRLKIQIATSKGVIVNSSDVENDYDRILKHSDRLDDNDRSRLCVFLNAQAEVFLRSYYVKDELPPTAIAPTEGNLRRAEYLLNRVPLKELTGEAYVYKGWHFLARSDLYMWRKQYPKAIEWAEKSQDQFTRGGIMYVINPQERLKLFKKLQAQEIQENNELEEIEDKLAAKNM